MRLELDGVSVECDIRGNGAPVLLLHGWGVDSASFLPVTKRLAETNKVVTVDFPGHGGSPEPPCPWSVDEYCALIAKLIERLSIAPCFIIGHSFGGRVAIMLCARRPELVKRAVLCGSAGIIPRRTLKYHVKVRLYKLGKKLGIKSGNAGSADYRALSETMKPTFVKVVNQDLRPLLGGISLPVLLIWGSEDKDTPLYMGRIMESEIADSALIIFEGAGHYAFLDDFARFIAIVNSFFGGNDAC